jgi:hypothetical protein
MATTTYQHTDGTPVTVTELTQLDAAMAVARDQHIRVLRSLRTLLSATKPWPAHTEHTLRARRAIIQAFMYLLARDPRARQAIKEWQDLSVEAAMAYGELGENMSLNIQVRDRDGTPCVTIDTDCAPNEADVLSQADRDKATHEMFEATTRFFDAIGAWAE